MNVEYNCNFLISNTKFFIANINLKTVHLFGRQGLCNCYGTGPFLSVVIEPPDSDA